jgi:hypothetical protein
VSERENARKCGGSARLSRGGARVARPLCGDRGAGQEPRDITELSRGGDHVARVISLPRLLDIVTHVAWEKGELWEGVVVVMW